MNFRLPGLRLKFVLALVIAAALPLGFGVLVLQTLGFRHLLAERGRIHEAEAKALADSLDLSVNAEAGKLRTWLKARPETNSLALESSEEGESHPGAVKRELADRDAVWPELSVDDPRLAPILENPAARGLQGYMAQNRTVAEVIVTDRFGRLVAATRKPTDFDQSDEEWWQVGMGLGEDDCWMDALHMDASAGVHSLDVVLGLHDETGAATGVVKLVLDVSSLFHRLKMEGRNERMEVVLPDGLLLPRDESPVAPLSITPEELLVLTARREGWTTMEDQDGERWMAGFAMIRSSASDNVRAAPAGFVIFASPRATVTAPVRFQLIWVAIGAGMVVLGCVVVGYLLVDRRILRPLSVLRNAAQSVARSAHLHLEGRPGGPQTARAVAESDLKRIAAIRTGDEIEALAGDVAAMTERVLRYQREMEAEVESKTSVIREDLEMAREFQHALLPSEYPTTPSDSHQPLRLGFSHFYEPASTVGGDFFDLIELGDGKVGVLIADVMGHGARSALVTAILRSLVRNHMGLMDRPGKFLEVVNDHLLEVISRSGQILFVSAFFMVLDPVRQSARWAVAGHPAPMRARRGNGDVPEPLWVDCPHQPALGLIEAVEYDSHEMPLRHGDVFLLYTDGLIEAEDSEGEMFGMERLSKAFDQALDGPLAAMPAQIVCQASAFSHSNQYEDDVCVVTVEVTANRVPAASLA